MIIQVRDCIELASNAYTVEDVQVMECRMLRTLNFQISRPTAVHFLEALQLANESTENHRAIAEYILDLALLESRMLRYRPSQLASAATLLSNMYLGRHPAWPQKMVLQSRYTMKELGACSEELRHMFENDQQRKGDRRLRVASTLSPLHSSSK